MVAQEMHKTLSCLRFFTYDEDLEVLENKFLPMLESKNAALASLSAEDTANMNEIFIHQMFRNPFSLQNEKLMHEALIEKM